MKPEILWKSESTTDFLADLTSFASELDYYEIGFDLETDEGKCILFANDAYEILQEEAEGVFECPECGNKRFEVLQGELDKKHALGLACNQCETYGAVFPNGI